jgi:hypothetical protein
LSAFLGIGGKLAAAVHTAAIYAAFGGCAAAVVAALLIGLRNYTNFLDVYVQAGLVPVESLTAGS